jgi:hypothetical protein
LLLADRRVGEIGRRGLQSAQRFSKPRLERPSFRKARLSTRGASRETKMSPNYFPVMLQENIETAGNKTDATAVWLVTDQVPRGTWFAELDRRWPFSRRSVTGRDVLRPETDVMAVGSTNQRGDPSHAHPS